jgi:archaellum component FlaC
LLYNSVVSNPNAFSSSDIERLRQTRDSVMERYVFLSELIILELSKMEDRSRDDIEVMRGEVQRLNSFQTMLQRHLHNLDKIL